MALLSQSASSSSQRSLSRMMLAGAGVLAALALLAWLTRADALFLELATAALAMCL